MEAGRDDETLKSGGATGSSERSDSEESSEDTAAERETTLRREVAGALGISDLNDPRVTQGVTEAQIREGATSSTGGSIAGPLSQLPADDRARLSEEELAKGFKRETEREIEELDAKVREISEFLPNGEGPGQGTYKQTRITQWGDGRTDHHEVRVGADGQSTITDLHFEGGQLVRSTQTELTEDGPVTKVLRGDDGPSETELSDFYGKIGYTPPGSGTGGGGTGGVSTGTPVGGSTGDSGSGSDSGGAGWNAAGGGSSIRDELSWGTGDVGGGDSGTGGVIGSGQGSGADDAGPASGSSFDDALGNLSNTGPTESTGFTAADARGSDTSATPPSSPPMSSFGTSTQTSGSGGSTGNVTSTGGTATELTPGVLGYIWVTNSDGSQTAYDPNTGMKVSGSGPDNIADADTSGGQGMGAPQGGDADDGSDDDGAGDSDTGDDESDGSSSDNDDDDSDTGDAAGDDGDDESSMPTDEQSGGTVSDPLGLVAGSQRPLVREGGPDYDPNADPVMGTGSPTVMPRGGGVTDPPQDSGDAAPDPLGLTAPTGPPRVVAGGPDYDPNADPVMGSGTPQVAPGGGGDPTVATPGEASAGSSGGTVADKQDVNGVRVDMATGQVVGSAPPATGGELASAGPVADIGGVARVSSVAEGASGMADAASAISDPALAAGPPPSAPGGDQHGVPGDDPMAPPGGDEG